MSKVKKTTAPEDAAPVTRLHLRFGWWALLASLSLGLVLEALHGFKIGYYLDVDHETRRLLWTLAHAHGTLLAVLNVVYALSLPHLAPAAHGKLASRSLLAAAVLMPVGFFLAGFGVLGGDPGLSIVLVIPGGLLLFLAVLTVARAS
jgi:hypothetical protein